MRCALPLLSLALAGVALAQLQVDEGRLCLRGPAGVVVRSISYSAEDDSGPVFATGPAALGEDGTVRFDLTGPGATQAAVSAQLRLLGPDGWALRWRVAYHGPERSWRGYSSGLRFAYATAPTGATTRPLVKWVRPTGAQPWEVKGDTLYPDTEVQLRQVNFGEQALAMLTPHYDPDWIYGGNVNRASFWSLVPPRAAGETVEELALFLRPAATVEASELAALFAGRPFSLQFSTGRPGNLFAPGEPIPLRCEVARAGSTRRPGRLLLAAHDYDGKPLLQAQEDLALSPGQHRTLDYTLSPASRGVIFVTATLSWQGGEVWQGTTVGVLPQRRLTPPDPSSPFGLAAVIANPAAYPDHLPLEAVLAAVQRIGVRWIRGGWFPLKADPTPEDEQRVRERTELLKRLGISPHVQLGARVPATDEQAAFRDKLRTSLERFAWVSPYVEVGNELNFSTPGAKYAEGLLKPVSEVTRAAARGTKVMTMGLGGVDRKWLEEFTQAGGLEAADILSIHPGSHPRAPEFWEGWRGWVFRSQVQDALKAAAAHGGKPVWITEVYAPTPPQRSQLDLRTSADYLVRTYLCALALGIPVVEWYQFQDGVWFAQRPRPDDVEYSFGIVYTDLAPKPAYVAYGAMTEQLEGAHYEGRLDLGAEDLYGCRFRRGGERIDVLWSYRERHETDLPWWPPEKYQDCSRKPGEPWMERWRQPVAVSLPCAGEVTVTDLMGNSRTVRTAGGKLTLQLTGSPVYVRGLGAVSLKARFWEELP